MKVELKRFSVFVDGQIVAVFDTVPEAKEYIDSHWWYAMASIWDHKFNNYILTEVRI